jgi:hypothetical protein
MCFCFAISELGAAVAEKLKPLAVTESRHHFIREAEQRVILTWTSIRKASHLLIVG